MGLEYPDNLKYSDQHEYASIGGDTTTIGVSAFAVQELGDIVFVEFPDVGSSFEKGDECGSIESVKAVSSLYAPLSGEVIEVNTDLEDAPEILNEDPYGKGWLLKIRPENPSELDDLMSASQYQGFLE